MDLSPAIVAKSDQWNADDLIAGPVTVTIASVTKGSSEQPINVNLVETPGRAYRPSKSMARVMVDVWGRESDAYTGHRMTLYRDPTVKFGGMVVGGIKIAAMTGLDKPKTIGLTETRGKKVAHTVQPLPDEKPAVTITTDDVDAATDEAQLRAMWRDAPPGLRARITARVTELQNSKTDVQNSNTGSHE